MSMFSTIKQALKNKKASNGNEVFKNFMKFEPAKPGTNGNEYVVRFLPFIKDPQYTFFEYISYNWNSLSTGKWINEISPVTFGERCPIAEEKTKIFNDKTSSQEDLDKARLLKRTKQWLANIYVINDPINPQNNGTIKILRMGKQLYDKVYNALDEENSESIGDAIFLNPNNSEGYNFRIICEQGPKFPTYARSDFSRNKTSIPGLENIDKIAESRYESYIEFVSEALEYKEKVKYNGVKKETAGKFKNNKMQPKISDKKRRAARNTLKQNIYKELDEDENE